MQRKRGFTIMELLMVIAIIGLLAAIILAALDRSREKGRDANRASQIQEFLKAAELYYSDNGRYPEDADGGTDGANPPLRDATGFLRADGGYMSSIPVDPLYGSNPSGDYLYCVNDPEGNSFTLIVRPESGDGSRCYTSRGPEQPAAYCDATLFSGLGAISDCNGRF